jgi:hypothetical protein
MEQPFSCGHSSFRMVIASFGLPRPEPPQFSIAVDARDLGAQLASRSYPRQSASRSASEPKDHSVFFLPGTDI